MIVACVVIGSVLIVAALVVEVLKPGDERSRWRRDDES